MKSIETLEISGFRGATRPVEIAFDNKNLVLIYGEEKAGKSTIVEALDYVCNRRHDPPLPAEGTDPHVRLRAGGQEWTTGAGDAGHGDPPRALVLRRNQVQQVTGASLDARPEAIRAFVDLPGISGSEAALRAALAQTTQKYLAAKQERDKAASTMDTLWRNAGKPGESCEDWIRVKAEADLTALKDELEDFKQALERLKVVENTHARMVKVGDEARRVSQTTDAAEAALAEALGALNEMDPEILDIMLRLRDHLLGHPAPEACPICGSVEGASGLAARLDNHLARTEQQRALRGAVQLAQQERGEAQAVHRQAVIDFTLAAADLSWYEGKPGAWVPAAPMANATEAEHRLAQAKVSKPRMAKHVGVAAQALKALKMRREVNRDWQKFAGEAQCLEDLSHRLEAMLAVVKAEREKYVNSLLVAAAEDAVRMYACLCPNERGTEARISALLGLMPVEGAPPNPTASGPECDPHLDALGVCVFLAIAQSSHRDGRLVVLDNVLSGLDESQLGWFLDMLEAEAPHSPPVIVTSHYQKCRDRYRARRSGKVQLIELAPWSPQFGIYLVQTKTASVQLRALLHPEHYDPQVAASKAGILLERLLDFLTLHYNAKMPRQETRNYTLGKLLSGVKSNTALLRDLRTEPAGDGAGITLKELIDDAARGDHIRNEIGAHHNIAAAGTHSREVAEFVENVLALSDALVCAECGELPQTDRGTFWQCGCKRGPRLFPHRPSSA